jgi:hypothetical protein
MEKIFLTVLVLFQISTHAQGSVVKNNFNVPVRAEFGDLNRDRVADKVEVTMDTADATVPLKLEIFFAQPGGKFKLVISSTRIIEPQYPAEKNGAYSGKQIPDFFIEDGILNMVSEIDGGQAQHQFRFQNGNFELVHVIKANWDGENTTTETDFNLLTGESVEIVKSLGSEKILKQLKKKVLIKPLPLIQNFKPFEKEMY